MIIFRSYLPTINPNTCVWLNHNFHDVFFLVAYQNKMRTDACWEMVNEHSLPSLFNFYWPFHQLFQFINAYEGRLQCQIIILYYYYYYYYYHYYYCYYFINCHAGKYIIFRWCQILVGFFNIIHRLSKGTFCISFHQTHIPFHVLHYIEVLQSLFWVLLSSYVYKNVLFPCRCMCDCANVVRKIGR